MAVQETKQLKHAWSIYIFLCYYQKGWICSSKFAEQPRCLHQEVFVVKLNVWTKSDCLTRVLLLLPGLQRFLFRQWYIWLSFEVSWTESRTSPAINSVGKAGPTERMWGQRLHSWAHCGKKRPAWPIGFLKPNHSQTGMPDVLVSLGEMRGNVGNKDKDQLKVLQYGGNKNRWRSTKMLMWNVKS